MGHGISQSQKKCSNLRNQCRKVSWFLWNLDEPKIFPGSIWMLKIVQVFIFELTFLYRLVFSSLAISKSTLCYIGNSLFDIWPLLMCSKRWCSSQLEVLRDNSSEVLHSVIGMFRELEVFVTIKGGSSLLLCFQNDIKRKARLHLLSISGHGHK